MSRLPKFNDLKFTKKPSTRAPQYAKEDARRTVEVAKRLAPLENGASDDTILQQRGFAPKGHLRGGR